MVIQFQDLNGITLYLGGDPELMDKVPDGEGTFVLSIPEDPFLLAKRLEQMADWVRRMQIRYPTDKVDCWIESQGA